MTLQCSEHNDTSKLIIYTRHKENFDFYTTNTMKAFGAD